MTVALIDSPQVVKEDLLEVIRFGIEHHPRSLQNTIGPSEVGTPCPRALLHKLAGTTEPDWGWETRWMATVGTATHTWLADAFIATNGAPAANPNPRYLIEQRVTVGHINGIPVAGSLDLFDVDAATVVDWKIVGDSRLEQYRQRGPGQQYDTQIQLYARGLARAGHFVRFCIIAFLPRNKALTSAYFHTVPYDETIAVRALERATGLARLSAAVGLDAAVATYPRCANTWCGFCATRRPFAAGPPYSNTPSIPFGRTVA